MRWSRRPGAAAQEFFGNFSKYRLCVFDATVVPIRPSYWFAAHLIIKSLTMSTGNISGELLLTKEKLRASISVIEIRMMHIT